MHLRRSKLATDLGEPASLKMPGYLESLRRYLERKGCGYSKPYLMGISGEAFRFFYNRARPANSLWVFLNNPLRSAASALGFQHEIRFHETYEEALDSLERTLRKEERPAIIRCGEHFPLVLPGGTVEGDLSEEVLSFESALGAWSPEEGFLELGLFGYYYFVLGERDREPNPRDVFVGAFRRALKIARAYRRVRGCSIGLQAYEELAAILRAKRDLERVVPSEAARIASWNALASRVLLESRRAAVFFLREAREAFPEEEAIALQKATRFYERVVSALTCLVQVHPTLDERFHERLGLAGGEPHKSALRSFYRQCHRAASYVERARLHEDRACDELQNVLNLSEKTRM